MNFNTGDLSTQNFSLQYPNAFNYMSNSKKESYLGPEIDDDHGKSQLKNTSLCLKRLVGTFLEYIQNTGRSRTANEDKNYNKNFHTRRGKNIVENGATTFVCRKEVYQHKTKDDAWMILHNKVYNVTDIINIHPGGVACLFSCVGLDGTVNFDDVGHSNDAWEMLRPYYIGDLPRSELTGLDNQKSHSMQATKKIEHAAANQITDDTCKEIRFTNKLRNNPAFRMLILIFTNTATILGLLALTLFTYLQSQKWSPN